MCRMNGSMVFELISPLNFMISLTFCTSVLIFLISYKNTNAYAKTIVIC